MQRNLNAFHIHKKRIVLAILSIGVLVPCITISATLNTGTTGIDIQSDFQFTKNLKQGDTVTPDVSHLQFILNQNPDTTVAETGGGSLSSLTNFFGSKTHSAILRFQEKYRDEILTPANIQSPTGIVGENTRKKLNQILGQLFSGTYTTSGSNSLSTSLNSYASSRSNKIFSSIVSKTSSSTVSSQIQRPPIITSFSTFKAVSGQLMSVFGAQFNSKINTLYLGSELIGDYPSSDNGSKITFKIPSTLETGSYEMGIVTSQGTTSTGTMYLDVVQDTSTSSEANRDFTPNLNEVYPKESKNVNDIIYISGYNFAFNNTIETNLGNTTVRSTNGKTIAFMISELPYYMEAFKKYKGQSINVLIKIRNENGLSTQQLVHVIRFPNSNSPTVNTSNQQPPAGFVNASSTNSLREMAYKRDLMLLNQNLASFTPTTSTSTQNTTNTRNSSTTNTTSNSTNNSSNDSSSNSSSIQLDPATQQLGQALGQSLLVQTIMQTSPIHQFVLGPLVNGGSSGGGSGGSSLLSGLGGGGGGGGSTAGGGGGGGNITFFGGQITQVTYCTCSGSILLAIKDIPSKQTLQVFYTYGQSTLHANYNIFVSGINVIGGLTQGGGQCQVYNGESCDTQGNAQYTIDTIRGVGTGSSPS